MPRYTMEQIEQALRESKGMVFLASRQLGCSHNTIKSWLERSPRLRELCQMEDGAVTDTAELKLYQAILEGQAWAIQYRLSRKGKDRGYGERIEVANPPGETLKVSSNIDELILKYSTVVEKIIAREQAGLPDGDGAGEPVDAADAD